MRNKKEIWKDVIGNDLYEVSNYGNIISKANPDTIRKPQINKHGYKCILFNRIEGKRKFATIHRLVATAFIPNPNNYDQINHIDGDKLNNNVNNLEWCNAFQNQQHRYSVLGHKTPNRVLTSEQAFEVMAATSYEQLLELSKQFNMKIESLDNVRFGHSYKKEYAQYVAQHGKPYRYRKPFTTIVDGAVRTVSVEEQIDNGIVKIQED